MSPNTAPRKGFRSWSPLLPLLLVVATGCATVPVVGQKSAVVELTGAKNLNSQQSWKGNRLGFRVYQLAEEPPMQSMTLDIFWDSAANVLEGSLLGEPQPGSLMPDTTIKVQLKLKTGAKYVLVAGNFSKPKGGSWYVVHPLAEGRVIRLNGGANGFTPLTK